MDQSLSKTRFLVETVPGKTTNGPGKDIIRAGHELAYGEPVSVELTDEDFERARALARYIACPSCGE